MCSTKIQPTYVSEGKRSCRAIVGKIVPSDVKTVTLQTHSGRAASVEREIQLTPCLEGPLSGSRPFNFTNPPDNFRQTLSSPSTDVAVSLFQFVPSLHRYPRARY